jgi:hypothetical protein
MPLLSADNGGHLRKVCVGIRLSLVLSDKTGQKDEQPPMPKTAYDILQVHHHQQYTPPPVAYEGSTSRTHSQAALQSQCCSAGSIGKPFGIQTGG